MAKTIMISNEMYDELKLLKRDMSFTELFKNLLNDDLKKGSGLRECLGILKKDEEWKKIEKDLKRGWKSWTKKYA
tara:strand:- start:5473 stop:5697 length:225 start_codon:yes stop_codon:yes gene_type:complete